MSSNTPPPAGPDGPEFLDPSGGEPLKPSAADGTRGGGRRTALIAGGAAVGLALVGGGVWAAMSFLATGTQPAEGLPDTTIGYASIDLDPSGGQKIEAFRMIQKFPALEEELDGFDADDDLLAKVFEDLEKECEGLDYDEDVKPWLGYRFAAAAVDLGEDQPTPVGVIQVTDAGAAEDGLTTLQECAGADVGGWAIDGEWAVIAESEELAGQVVEATVDGTLADDATFQEWNDAVGDAGVMSLYAAPEAGAYLAEGLASPISPLGGPMGLFGGMPPSVGDELTPELDAPDATLPEDVEQALEDFEGMAATLRFSEGSLEFEGAAGLGGNLMQSFAGDNALATVGSLPDDTAAVFGLGLPEGWFQQALEQAEKFSDGEMTAADMLAELEAQTGLTGDDIETLLGESAALAVGSGLDAETLFGSSDGSDVPIGARIQGDADGIQEVLAKISGMAGGDAGFLGNDAEGDHVAVGPNADYRQQLLEDGGLGDSEAFQNVVREADDAGTILFVNFQAGDWLADLAASDPEAKENLEPLQGIGFSSWMDDGTTHGVFRLTID